MFTSTPVLYSGFEGVAVARRRLHQPERPQPGYLDFLDGVKSSGVELGSLITRRHALGSRLATRAIHSLGIDTYFDSQHVIYAGSESAKGKVLARQSMDTPQAMLHDRPRQLVLGTLAALEKLAGRPTVRDADDRVHEVDNMLTVGVVSPAGHEEIPALVRELPDIKGLKFDYDTSERVLTIKGRHFMVHVEPVGAYSELDGEIFGEAILQRSGEPGH